MVLGLSDESKCGKMILSDNLKSKRRILIANAESIFFSSMISGISPKVSEKIIKYKRGNVFEGCLMDCKGDILYSEPEKV